MKSHKLSFALTSLAALLCAAVASVHAAMITVTSIADSGAGTLRAALASAADGDIINATGVSGTILLASGELVVSNSVTILGPGPATLAVDGNAAGRVFSIRSNLVVSIAGLTITNGLASAHPDVGGGIYNDHSTLTVSNCTLSGNSAVHSGGGICNDGSVSGISTVTVIASTLSGNSAGAGSPAATRGGGILNVASGSGSATMTISASALSGNSASNNGGGILNRHNGSGSATVTISASTITGNSGALGGGIFNIDVAGSAVSATVTISASSISGNSAYNGGGINNQDATVMVANSTLSGNSAGSDGGGIYNLSFPGSAKLTLIASTLSGNSAGGKGGGILNAGLGDSATVTISASTLSGNSANSGVGGGILSGGFPGIATLEIGDTILQRGASGQNIENIDGTVISRGFNLSSDDAGGGLGTAPGGLLNGTADQRNTDPLLGPLQDNGGPTFTHALLPGSPAIDQGRRNAIPALALNTDQRGFPRPVDFSSIANAADGDGSDIGAFEVQILSADLLVSLGVDKTNVKQGEQLTYTITVHNFGPDAAANVVVNDTLSGGSTFVSAQANRGNFTTPAPNQTGTVTWNLGELSNGAEGAQLVVKVIVRGKATITNTATASTDSSDPNPANNSASITTSVAPGGKK